jgi:hypothetical protein
MHAKRRFLMENRKWEIRVFPFSLSLQVGKSYRGIGRKAALNLDGSAPRL